MAGAHYDRAISLSGVGSTRGSTPLSTTANTPKDHMTTDWHNAEALDEMRNPGAGG